MRIGHRWENARREEAKLLELDVSSRKFDSPEGFGGQVTSMERDPASLPSAPLPRSPPSENRVSPFAPPRNLAPVSVRLARLRPSHSPTRLSRSLPLTLHPLRDQLLSRTSLAWQRFHGTDVCTHRTYIYAPPLTLGTSPLWKILSPSVKGCEIRRFVNRCITSSRLFPLHVYPDVPDSPCFHLSTDFSNYLSVCLSLRIVLYSTLYISR